MGGKVDSFTERKLNYLKGFTNDAGCHNLPAVKNCPGLLSLIPTFPRPQVLVGCPHQEEVPMRTGCDLQCSLQNM